MAMHLALNKTVPVHSGFQGSQTMLLMCLHMLVEGGHAANGGHYPKSMPEYKDMKYTLIF